LHTTAAQITAVTTAANIAAVYQHACIHANTQLPTLFRCACHSNSSPSFHSAALPSAEAPAGSYVDKVIGKLCQKGTYSTALNSDSTCQTCPPGITTASEGSTTAEACSLAMKGYYINPSNANEAIVCPVNTYQDQEAAVTSCTACPNGWKTKETGATGVALCLVPPGYELKENAAEITVCDVGSYKADWNRNPCTPVSWAATSSAV
jgi:hypothetical protein